MTAYAVELAHLVQLAGMPAYRAHAVLRAAELEKDSSGQWRGIAAALDIEIKTRRAAAVLARETTKKELK